MARDDTQDVFDLRAAWFEVLHKISDHGFDDVERDRRAHILPRCVKPRDSAFKFAAVFNEARGEKFQNVARQAERRIDRALFSEPLFQNLHAQFVVKCAKLGDEAALKTRAHALIKAIDVVRRPSRRHNHLLAAIQQRVDDVVEFALGLFAVQEFEIVDQKQVDVAEPLLERQRIGRTQRFDKLIAEALGRQIQHLRVRRTALHFPGDGVEKMGFSKSD